MFGSLFNKAAGLKVCNFFKNNLQYGCFLWILQKFFRIAVLDNTFGGWLLLTVLPRYNSAGVPILWFRASTCFRIWSKTFTKRCINNSLLLRDKTISSLHFFLALKAWRWKSRFSFCSPFVYFADLKTIYLRPVYVVAPSSLNYIGPYRWF